MKRKKLILEAKETFETNTEDIFPYVEAAIDVMDDNLNWWKNNWEELEKDIKDALEEVGEKDATINTRFTIFNGTDEDTPDVIWHGPAIEYDITTSEDTVEQVKDVLGDTWNGHKVFTDGNSLIVLFE